MNFLIVQSVLWILRLSGSDIGGLCRRQLPAELSKDATDNSLEETEFKQNIPRQAIKWKINGEKYKNLPPLPAGVVLDIFANKTL